MTFDNPRAADAPQSPFPDSLPVLATGGRAPVPVALHESPFPSLYEALEGEAGDPQDEWVDELLEGLHDLDTRGVQVFAASDAPDGVRSDVPWAVWKGPSDLSARVYFAWSNEGLSLAAA